MIDWQVVVVGRFEDNSGLGMRCGGDAMVFDVWSMWWTSLQHIFWHCQVSKVWWEWCQSTEYHWNWVSRNTRCPRAYVGGNLIIAHCSGSTAWPVEKTFISWWATKVRICFKVVVNMFKKDFFWTFDRNPQSLSNILKVRFWLFVLSVHWRKAHLHPAPSIAIVGQLPLQLTVLVPHASFDPVLPSMPPALESTSTLLQMLNISHSHSTLVISVNNYPMCWPTASDLGSRFMPLRNAPPR